MRRVAILFLAAICAALGARAAPLPIGDPQPCGQLAREARGLPAKAWVSGRGTLDAWVRMDDPPRNPPRFEAKLAALPTVREALGDDGGSWTLLVDHLAGTDIYAAYDVQGTANCQNIVFLNAHRGRAPIIIGGPRPLGEGDLCFGDSVNFGQVFGRPAFIEHSILAPTSETETYVITPWIGGGWAASCRLQLRYRTHFAETEHFCGDADVCRAAGREAEAIATAFGKARARAEPRATGDFAYGPDATPEAKAMVKRVVDARRDLAETPVFPTFGATAETEFPGYSYEGLAFFPLGIDGRYYFAVIGHGGVGWREIGDTLLGIYEADGDRLKPLAGFVIARSLTGLKSAQVDRYPTEGPR
jgi:hypothetical protein